jgi:glycosyltransferase involved in cell wall biosynthesis
MLADVKDHIIVMNFEKRWLQRYRQDALIPQSFTHICLPRFRDPYFTWINYVVFVFSLAYISFKYDLRGINVQSLLGFTFVPFVRVLFRNTRIIAEFHGGGMPSKLKQKLNTSKWINRLVIRLLEHLDSRVPVWSDVVLTSSHVLRDFYKNLAYPRNTIFETIPCAVDMDLFAFSPKDRQRMREKLGWTSNFIVVFNGSWQDHHLPTKMMSFFLQLCQSGIPAKFLILTTANVHDVKNALFQAGISSDDCRILSLPHEKVPEYLMAGDVGLMLIEQVWGKRFSSPIKMGEYLACGLPVLATSHIGDTTEILNKDPDVGITLDIRNGEQLSRLVEYVQRISVSDRMEVAQKCREVARKWLSWETFRPKLRAVYLEVLHSR